MAHCGYVSPQWSHYCNRSIEVLLLLGDPSLWLDYATAHLGPINLKELEGLLDGDELCGAPAVNTQRGFSFPG